MTIKFGNFANFIVRNLAVIWEAPRKTVSDETLRNEAGISLSFDVWISLVGFEQGNSLLKWAFSLLFPGFFFF